MKWKVKGYFSRVFWLICGNNYNNNLQILKKLPIFHYICQITCNITCNG